MKSILIIAAAALVGLAACSEENQVVMFDEPGEYKGKPDELPWNSAPLGYGTAEWDKGNKQSWESQLKRRVMAQNETVRIEHP